MKLMRSILSLALAVLLVCSLGAGVFAADYPESGFVDVPRDAWYTEAVDYVKYAGLMNGVGENRFDPAGTVTRAMIVTVLYRMMHEPDVSGMTCPFVDVPVGEWYFNAVIWAANTGVTTGVDNSHFAPTEPISREQMAAMIVRMAISSQPNAKQMTALLQAEFDKINAPGYTGKDKPLKELFTDGESISSWAQLYVYIAKIAGVMNGDSAGTFRPKASLSRAECAKTFQNLAEVGASLLGH